MTRHRGKSRGCTGWGGGVETSRRPDFRRSSLWENTIPKTRDKRGSGLPVGYVFEVNNRFGRPDPILDTKTVFGTDWERTLQGVRAGENTRECRNDEVEIS